MKLDEEIQAIIKCANEIALHNVDSKVSVHKYVEHKEDFYTLAKLYLSRIHSADPFIGTNEFFCVKGKNYEIFINLK